MLIRPISDIHLDFDYALRKRFKLSCIWEPIELDTDSETTLLIAGDLWIADKPLKHAEDSWLRRMSERFKYVVFVLGNHDLWSTNITQIYRKFQNKIALAGLDNVHLLEKSSIVLDGYRFIGATLWTDMNRDDPHTRMSMDLTMMNDHKRIRVGTTYRRFKWYDWAAAHIEAKNYIDEEASLSPEPCIVVSHHAPCPISVSPHYKDDFISNGFYSSDLTSVMFNNPNILLWAHGHVHKKFDYLIGNTRVICNPRGYFGQNDETDFDQKMIINTNDLNKLEEEIDRWNHFEHLL